MPRATSSRVSTFVIAFVLLTAPSLVGPVQSATAAEGDVDPVVLSGRVFDMETDQPLEGVVLMIENHWEPAKPAPEGDDAVGSEPAREGHQSKEVTTGPNGSYEVELHPGWVNLHIEEEGYMPVSAHGELRENATLDVPMRVSDAQTATITGIVADEETGQPIADASVSVSPDWEQDCGGDACPVAVREARADEPTRSKQGTFSIYYESGNRQYDHDDTDDQGRYTLQVAPGDVVVRAGARDHLDAQQKLVAVAGQTHQVHLNLAPIPPNSVRVTGTVRDAVSGDPIPHASVNLRNQQWGHWNHTMTDEQGNYELYTKPGYTLIEVSAHQEYWVPCEDEGALDSGGKTVQTSSGGGADGNATAARPASDEASSASVAVSEPYPAPCESQEREHDYLSRVNTFVGAEGSTLQYDAELERAPGPDATYQGWVVNASSQEGIAGAWVRFWNEETNEWGQVQTDEDGSYTIDVRAGYFTVRAHAEKYFESAVNNRIESGETKTLVLELEPGRSRYGGCCIAYAEDHAVASSAPSAAAERGASLAEAEERVSSDGDAAGDDAAMAGGQGSSSEGEAAYTGSGGGLGPYDANAQRVGGDDVGAETPVAGLVPVLAMISLGAVALRLWHRD